MSFVDAYRQMTGGNRGGNERMTYHAAPVSPQPDFGEYDRLGRQ